MAEGFLSSEDYDERAHQLYNSGDYEGALKMLKEGLSLYPNAVELCVGLGYARLAREEYAWARKAFDRALVLDQGHEDALVGLGETLLRFGECDAALALFERVAFMPKAGMCSPRLPPPARTARRSRHRSATHCIGWAMR